MATRQASHAGSWYTQQETTLSQQLDDWLAKVPETIQDVGSIPRPGARIIIAP